MKHIIQTILALAYGTEIALPSDLLPSKHTDADFEKTAKSSDFLDYLSLVTSSTEKGKSGDFPINNFAVVSGDNYDDLGKEVDALVLDWRPLAMQTGGDTLISTNDVNDPEFDRIKNLADNTKDSGCMHGPQFLLYLPSRKKFVTMFFGSKSARKEAPAVRANMQKSVTFKAKKCQTPQYTWYTANAAPCNTVFDLPEIDKIVEQVNKFRNPPVNKIEKVAPAASNDR